MVLNIDFARPLSGAETPSVAIWTYDLSSFSKDGYAWIDASGSNAVNSALTQAALTLPALSASETALLTAHKAATGMLRTDKTNTAAKAAANKRLKDFDEANPSADLKALRVETNATYVKAELAALAAEADKAKTAPGLRAKADYLKSKVIPAEMKLAERVANRTRAASTVSDLAKASLEAKRAQRAALGARMASGMMYLNATATVTFTKKANEYLLAVGKALSEKSEELKTAAVNELDLDNSVEIQAIQDVATAKTETLGAISVFYVAQATAVLDAATAEQKLTAETAFIEATASCRVLEIKGISLADCNDLPASAL